MCERPVKFSGFCIERTELQRAVADPGYWNDLRVVPGREDLIRLLEILISQRLLDHSYAACSQQSNDPLPGNPCEKCSIGDRRQHHAVLCHEHIRGGKLGDI